MLIHKTPLIVRLPNWVGDVVMTLPALQALSDAGFDLHTFGRPWVMDLLSATDFNPAIVPRKIFAASKTLRCNPAKNMLLFVNSFSSAAIARLAGKKPLGYYSDLRNSWLEKGLHKKPGAHELEYFWQIARLAAEYWRPSSFFPAEIPGKISLHLTAQQRAAGQILLQKFAVKSPYWVLCPMAHGQGLQGQSKIWPHWSELAEILLAAGKTLIVCPGPAEEILCENLLPNIKLLPGLNLSQYLAILASAEQVIANDSGPMHMAAAVGVPILGIFGVSDPVRTRPWGGDFIGSANAWPDIEAVLQKIL